jgi:hypothetical protein
MQSMQKDKWVERGCRLRKTLINFATAVWFIVTAVVTPILLVMLAYVMGMGSSEKNHALQAAFYGVMFGALFAGLLISCVERKLR